MFKEGLETINKGLEGLQRVYRWFLDGSYMVLYI